MDTTTFIDVKNFKNDYQNIYIYCLLALPPRILNLPSSANLLQDITSSKNYIGDYTMYVLYHSDNEYQQHSKAILSIAEQYQLKEAVIRKIYENVLKDLQAKARLKKFLLVLVTRHVKELLHKSRRVSPK